MVEDPTPEKAHGSMERRLRSSLGVEQAHHSFPKYVTTTEEVGRAMIRVALRGAPKRVLESQDIQDLGRGA
jgi:hypothetical protein